MWLVAHFCTLAALSAEAHLYTVDAAKSSIGFTLIHKMHTVKGEAKKGVEGKAKVSDGGSQVAVRAAVTNFDSGNANRDAHMMEVIEAAKFPSVELKAVADVKAPSVFPSKAAALLRGQLTFHGVTQPVEVKVELAWDSAKTLRVTGKFPVSLEAHKVERPSLMFVKVDDSVEIAVDFTLSE